ncbi:MAG: 23S rRNA (adenine(2503)-C(2))-methyltransferase RlmN, partial [Alphaproteobacteria bacterium]|nr:23S rRNA (adenine(2503)-C(2))-methyltransferase RlmN [Alphaproteobacteria bacterium]
MTGTAQNLDRAADPRLNLLGMDRPAISRAMAGLGAEPFRADQLYNWIYARGVTDLEAMTNLSKDLRQRLAADFRIELPRVALHQRAQDGTRKWLLDFDDRNAAETVHIPEPDRGTLCISSQVGCTLTCAFCHTGTQRLVRNLAAGEIVGQVMLAQDALGARGAAEDRRKLTNIVLMGMGEPLYNYPNVKAALGLIMDGNGIGISRHRITLSTSGIVPEIGRCGEELGVLLAISLHAVTDELRDRLVPINRKY